MSVARYIVPFLPFLAAISAAFALALMLRGENAYALELTVASVLITGLALFLDPLD